MIFHSTRVLGLAVLPLALTLAACGGDSTPAPTPKSDRIEPYDPGASKAASESAISPSAVAPSAYVVKLGPLAASLASKAMSQQGLGTALQIGQSRSVTDTASVTATSALLQWQPTTRGTQVSALRFVAEGARGIRLGVFIEALPEGAVLRFYGKSVADIVEVSARQLQDTARRNVEAGVPDAEARTYWSPDFGGSETSLEIEIPSTANSQNVRIAVPRLSHFTSSPSEAQEKISSSTGSMRKAGESESCNINATCVPDYLDQSRSVARMVYVIGGNSFLCTGTLLNDAKSSGTPYFLTANHCISDQAVASTLNTDWFYRAAACESSEVNPATKRLTGGATLLYSTSATDVALLRLNDAPPAGTVYAGSYFGAVPSAGTAAAALHHPGGDLQKFSLGTVLGNASCVGNADCTSAQSGSFLELGWKQGITEQGSSGSAAFVQLDGQRYVVGQLFGGQSSCQAPNASDYYGRFDVSYRSALQKWLNP
ncbi:MAG: trypsin-like peptidase domain-containing protein [Comamonadaceae bacterium]|nr:trypsin-like peptidase domain-containing protein [Comamonadaceae bacterium]